MRNPVLIVMSILAALQAIAGAANLADLLGDKLAAWFVLLVAAAQIGSAYWVRGQVTPVADPRDNSGRPLLRAKDGSPV